MNLGIMLALIVAGFVTLAYAALIIRELSPLIKQMAEVSSLSRKSRILTVEAEITRIIPRNLIGKSTLYFVTFGYSIGMELFEKEMVFAKETSFFVGQKVTLLCDVKDPEKAMIKSSGESSGIMLLFLKLTGAVALIFLFFFLSIITPSD